MDPAVYEAARDGDLIFLQNMTSKEKCNLGFHLASNGDTVLHVATEFNRTEFIKTITQDCPALLWVANSNLDTALHVAAREGFDDTIRFFINFVKTQRADVEAAESATDTLGELLRKTNLDYDTALHCAARRGCYRSVELLVGADAEGCSFVNKANESPLYLAVASGFHDVPELIIKHAPPVPPAGRGAKGLTALHPTLLFSTYALNKIEVLVKWMPQMIREGDLLGLTPLHYAALYGRTEAIKLFLRYDNSAVYLVDTHGESALHLAAFHGRCHALEALITCRPDSCNLVDNKGRTILHASVLGNQNMVVARMMKIPSLARLINKPDKDGNTPLHLAAQFKSYIIIQILGRCQNVNLGIVNKEFSTALEVHNSHEEYGVFAMASGLQLKNSKSAVGMQRFADAQVKKMTAGAELPAVRPKAKTANANKETDSESDYEQKSAVEVNLLIAILVATVTFAAGFTMPGGYVNEGADKGLAILTTRGAFTVFVMSDAIAFYWSLRAVLLHFQTSNWGSGLRLKYREDAALLTTQAIYAMAIAFSSGTFVVLSKFPLYATVLWMLFALLLLDYIGNLLEFYRGWDVRRLQLELAMDIIVGTCRVIVFPFKLCANYYIKSLFKTNSKSLFGSRFA